MQLTEPYAPRRVSSMGIWPCGDWRLKKYTIAYTDAPLDLELVAAAERAAIGTLPTQAITDARYGVGFVGTHEGRSENAHKANLLDPSWREIGISARHTTTAPGIYNNQPVTIITTDFGARR